MLMAYGDHQAAAPTTELTRRQNATVGDDVTMRRVASRRSTL